LILISSTAKLGALEIPDLSTLIFDDFAEDEKPCQWQVEICLPGAAFLVYWKLWLAISLKALRNVYFESTCL